VIRLEFASLRWLRGGWSSATIVILLAAAAAAGDREFLGILRGEYDETETVPLGYYEGLLRVPGSGRFAPNDGPPPGWVAFGAEEAGLVEEIPSYLRWRMKPNLDTTWNGSVFRTNSLGYRSPEISVKKPSGTYRILVFGSSNSMGYGIGNDEMYSSLLERWLDEQAGRPEAVEVVNLAVSGDSPSRRLYRMQQDAKRLDPDWILCDVSCFDSWLEDRHIQACIERGLPIAYPYIEEAIRRTGARGGVSHQEFTDHFQGESERLADDVYAEWAAEARRLGVPLTLVILPRSDTRDKWLRLLGVIHGHAARHGLEFLDLSSAFESVRIEDVRVSNWDRHTNATGHRIIFEAIRAAVISRGGLPRTTPRR
jgi:lysophospholipase L1-like esterase